MIFPWVFQPSQELRIPRQHDPARLDIHNGPRLTRVKRACHCMHVFVLFCIDVYSSCISLISFSSFHLLCFDRQQMILFYPTGMSNWAASIGSSLVSHSCLLSTLPRNRSARLKSSGPTAIKDNPTPPSSHPLQCWDLGFADPGHYYKLLHLQGLSQQHLSVSRIAPGLQFLHPTWESYEVHGGIDSSWYQIAWRKCVPMPGVEFSELMCLRQDPGMTCLILWWCHISPRNTQAARPRRPEARLLQPFP